MNIRILYDKSLNSVQYVEGTRIFHTLTWSPSYAVRFFFLQLYVVERYFLIQIIIIIYLKQIIAKSSFCLFLLFIVYNMCSVYF